jgi:hypothetical protein
LETGTGAQVSEGLNKKAAPFPERQIIAKPSSRSSELPLRLTPQTKTCGLQSVSSNCGRIVAPSNTMNREPFRQHQMQRENGEILTVNEFHWVNDTTTMRSKFRELTPIIAFKTEDDLPVRKRPDGRFEMAKSKEILTPIKA